MFPIKRDHSKTYLHGQWTFYGARHRGEDYIVPVGTKIYAPFAGEAQAIKGLQGGNMIYFYTNKYVIRFLHLSKYLKLGRVKEGDLIALSGNTGVSTAPHVHMDISKIPFNLSNFNNFLDPAKFSWHNNDMACEAEKETIRELNTEIGTVTEARDNYIRLYEKEVEDHKEALKQKTEHYENWQREIDARKKAEAELATCLETGSLTPEQTRILAWFDELKALL